MNDQKTNHALTEFRLTDGLGSPSFEAGKTAKINGEKLKNSAIKKLRPGCKQYDDFVSGYYYDFVTRYTPNGEVRGGPEITNGDKDNE